MRKKILAIASVILLLTALGLVNTDLNNPAQAAQTSAASALVGKSAPAFTLTDTNGKKHGTSDAAGKYLVLEWINFDCPFVRRHYENGQMQKLQKTYTGKGVIWFSICSSAAGRQGNYPNARLNELIAQNKAQPTAYLIDPDGLTGKAYGATSTPHMFIINPKGEIIYQGAIDDNPSGDISEGKAPSNYVQRALDEALAAKPVTIGSTQAYGCSIKYKK